METALQIVTKAILAGENNDKRTDDIEKLEPLLYSGTDVNVIPDHDITLVINLARSEYPEKEKTNLPLKATY